MNFTGIIFSKPPEKGVSSFVIDDHGDNPDNINNEEDAAVQPAPEKGLIVIFDYEKDNNDEDGPAQPP